MYIYIYYIIMFYYIIYIYSTRVCNMNNKLVGCQELLIGLLLLNVKRVRREFFVIFYANARNGLTERKKICRREFASSHREGQLFAEEEDTLVKDTMR